MAMTVYRCKGGCGTQQSFSTANPLSYPGKDGWTCGKCAALEQQRAATYARALPPKDKADRLTAIDVARFMYGWQPNFDPFVMPVHGKSPLGIMIDDMGETPTSYQSCEDHKGDYGANCIACDNDRAAYRRSKK